jgi:hypothetical protein
MKDLYVFLAVIVQMGHDHKPNMKLYWTKDELYCVPFCSCVMSRDHFLKIPKYFLFTDSQNPWIQDREDHDYDRLWKIRQIFHVLNSKISELHHPTDHMVVDEVIIKFKGKVIFW